MMREVGPERTGTLLPPIARRFSTPGLLADDAMAFIGTLVTIRKHRHCQPGSKDDE